jgi:hypothetical protein
MVGSFFFNSYKKKLLGCVAYRNKLLHVGIGDGFLMASKMACHLVLNSTRYTYTSATVLWLEGSSFGVELGINNGSSGVKLGVGDVSLEIVIGQDNLLEGSGHGIAVNIHRNAVNMLSFTKRGTEQPSFGARPVFSSGRIVYWGQGPTFP